MLGASTMYVAPKSVSGRVVKTRITSGLAVSDQARGPSAMICRPLPASMGKSTSAPKLRPTQLRCMSMIGRGQSTSSSSSIKRSAYAVMRSIHCVSGMRMTGKPPRSLLPSMTSSLASTVPSSGHQFTGTRAR